MEIASIIIAAAAASCSWIPQEGEGQAKIIFKISGTKAAATDDFLLTVTSGGKTHYDGRFGDRPAELEVPAGDCQASIISGSFDKPQFNAPQLGDSQSFTLEAGKTTTVKFTCTLQNAGLKLTFTDNFKIVYPEGPLKLTQDGITMEYPYSCTETAYFREGLVFISYAGEIIATISLDKGVVETLEMDAAVSTGGAVFSVTVIDPLPEKSGSVKITDPPTLSVAQAKSLPPADSLKTSVCGYIVGGVKSNKVVRAGAEGYDISSNILIADNLTDSTLAQCMPVELKTQSLQSALSLTANPSLAGKKVCVKGTVLTYFSTPGLKGVVFYKQFD